MLYYSGYNKEYNRNPHAMSCFSDKGRVSQKRKAIYNNRCGFEKPSNTVDKDRSFDDGNDYKMFG
jgi:hypothetical protein